MEGEEIVSRELGMKVGGNIFIPTSQVIQLPEASEEIVKLISCAFLWGCEGSSYKNSGLKCTYVWSHSSGIECSNHFEPIGKKSMTKVIVIII